jgi:hypothetical protein
MLRLWSKENFNYAENCNSHPKAQRAMFPRKMSR